MIKFCVLLGAIGSSLLFYGHSLQYQNEVVDKPVVVKEHPMKGTFEHEVKRTE